MEIAGGDQLIREARNRAIAATVRPYQTPIAEGVPIGAPEMIQFGPANLAAAK